ncbi:MAG: 50S ribosomal protein L5 [Elusimicrobiales bacterium]|nr:50S ribosomal protein L5 [Elusimicrobiales bacterium]MCK5583203.1 50S ribosomal protein L5 [Elusimicrobiales bacterium]
MTKEKEKKESGGKKYTARLKEEFNKKILPALMKELGYSSPMAIPHLDKIVINMGINEAKENIQALDKAKDDLAAIVGQLPQTRRAKVSISNFKLREGMPIGLKVTLRDNRMYDFFDKFVSISVPRIRDFQGISSKGFDGNGNLNMGLREHHIFPEIDIEKSPKAQGMNITFVTTAKDNKTAQALLKYLGMPFEKPKKIKKAD